MATKKKSTVTGNPCRLSRAGMPGCTPKIPEKSLVMGYKLHCPIKKEKERMWFVILPDGDVDSAEYEDGTIVDLEQTIKHNKEHIVWNKYTMRQLYQVYGNNVEK